ncbi:tRNA (adenosine(37)-N6)-threonylcarbamoyltransferase complex ATPase subunit type 1 TsaE [candidate division WWE3 bacterium CG08_land_8_20_14_0_20_40_13]|uniref:tRNA threonylcarbamoyladenosine biosynthesis protein TsaE n=1 Tax=candidate division WWE3 bacterium CG08_land_8_20_14_0_20_40_13 TaxID=1975084 RepID=A0A2H0XG45_UNCKA|nr:MAG: tRNA (adenosine(37)-N6)-threonylcarbamoyltransferase complex ATPase subunit type 1 TsaE [candidate division WWE3 bacterium CG08_land_8_20_14_0_20_40_13]
MLSRDLELRMKRLLKGERETKKFSEKVLNSLNGKNVILLFGELGSGKTTFTQGIAEALGIKERITSPTFVLSRIYKIKLDKLGEFDQLTHFDLYRIKTAEEILDLGLKEYLEDTKTLIVIEWPELVDDMIAPEKKLSLKFSYGEDDMRFVEVF